ncbi:protein DpdJ [Paenibacillus algorifonticola]|uniref:protein DpdJ n=1 Tax=Paenibacillus algorifonticola TaxID=684063 RepID=UPI003D2B7A56
MPTTQQLSDFLSFLEDEEAKLLAWGYVEGGFTDDELMDLTERWISERSFHLDPHALINSLEACKALSAYSIPTGSIWRSRMAESVRLFVRLRQVFDAKSWSRSSTLVSDFRFTTQKRTYPARNIDGQSVLAILASEMNDRQLKAVSALLTREKPILLSRFQMRATVSMTRSLKVLETSGMIVCAGTGTGKTLSFYLPALSAIASWVEKTEFWTKAIAIYPRNELLKDQFLETYLEARRLDAFLVSEKKRKLRIGAMYGSVPYNSIYLENYGWKKHTNGHVCPFLKCPEDNCQSAMIWRYSDAQRGQERLFCEKCQKEIEEDEIVLTRERMKKEPPDVLFTTTEMLNRLMNDLSARELIGIGAKQNPRLVLLDEVHTYGGIHGAQVALLLRRWQHAVGKPLHFTGLSATLEDAQTFFSQLTATKQHFVEVINVGEDLIEEGKEYQLILKGDPSSGTSLLSTTIQSAMLARRILDSKQDKMRNNFFGTKVFVFTDDLDVTNRLYDNLRDAEGLNAWNRRKKDPLAATRRHNFITDPVKAFQAGQSWTMAERIGHDLRRTIVIDRTSSQDSGVAAEAEVVVATASLEVGYNDPEVGVVIQHKAPLDMASFMQRKGRAGRRRGMRPWTVTILSDFGRDRMMYLNFESLFNPALSKKTLPLHNRYVLRMQAVYAFMDWVAEQLQVRLGFTFGSLWIDFSGPKREVKFSIQRQQEVAKIIEEVLTKTHISRNLEGYLQEALGVSADEMSALLWDPPRALFTQVLPTLHRRLKTGWGRFDDNEGGYERYSANHPLPEFIPSNLFSDLHLPEISFEFVDDKDQYDVPAMSIVQGLNAFAPGKVSRRFGNRRMQQSHWIAPSSLERTSLPQPLMVNEFCTEYVDLGMVSYETEEGTLEQIRCFRPWILRLSNVPAHVEISSNASQIWKSQIISLSNEDNKPIKINVPSGVVWNNWIRYVSFYTHNHQTAVIVKRFSIGSEAVIRHHSSQKVDIDMRYMFEQEPIALGFSLETDGVMFHISVPDQNSFYIENDYSARLQSFRPLFFQHMLSQDERLKGIANAFLIDRLSETYLSALSATAVLQGCTLEHAFQLLKGVPLRSVCDKVLNVIFMTTQSGEHENGDDETSDDNDEMQYQRAHAELLALCENEIVSQILYEHVPCLWSLLGEKAITWARHRWATTLGAALLQSCKEISNQHARDDLIMDIRYTDSNKTVAEIWITESTSGGVGVVEDIMQKYHTDPRRFYRLVESALGISEMEQIDVELSRIMSIYGQDERIMQLFREVREFNGYRGLSKQLQHLKQLLHEHDVLATHSVMNSLYNRILKPGSSELTDLFLRDIMALWKAEEERIGIFMDVRVFAYVFSSNDVIVERFKKALHHIDTRTLEDANWRFHVIVGMLWPRGNQVRTRALIAHNPFEQFPPTDRELILHGFASSESVNLADDDWWSKVNEKLKREGSVRLVAASSTRDKLQEALLKILSEPIEVGFLHVYPRIEGLTREIDSITVILDIREV